MNSDLQALLLIAAGAVFGLLLLVVVLRRTLAGSEKTGFFDLLLVFLTTALVVLALVFDHQTPDEAGQPLVENGALVLAAVLAVFSLLVMLLELRRPQRLRDSRGVLMLWAALLMALSTFTVPLIADNLVTTPEAVTVAIAPTAPAAAANGESEETDDASDAPTRPPSATPTTAATATPPASATPTMTPTPRATSSATPTRQPFVYNSPTPPATATLPTPCVGSVLYNLRLRAAPDPESETLLTIPFDTTLTIYGKDAPSHSYWFTVYEDTEGWVDSTYVQAASACNDLPVRTG